MDDAKLGKLLQRLQAVPYESWFEAYGGHGYGTRIDDFTFFLHTQPKDPRYRDPRQAWYGIEYIVTLEVDVRDHKRISVHTQAAIGPPGHEPAQEPSLFKLYSSIPDRYWQQQADAAKGRAAAAQRKLETFIEAGGRVAAEVPMDERSTESQG